MPTTNTTRESIIMIINHEEEIHGTEQLAIALNAHNKHWLILNLRDLNAEGSITITPSAGGRGRKTIYKRNRNSAGMARKVKP